MKKKSLYMRILFLVLICTVIKISNSFSKNNDISEHNSELYRLQQKIHKKLLSSSEENEIKIWKDYLKKYPLAKDAIELELLYSFPAEDLLEKDIYLWRPTNLDGNAAGNIFISDQKWCHIFQFDSSGVFLKKIGAKGQGPGEFINPYCINLTKDFLAVSDTNGRKIQFFDRDGKYLRSIKVTKPYFEIVADVDGFIYASPLRWDKKSLLIDVLDNDGHLIHSFGKPRFGNETKWNIPNMIKLAMNSKSELFAVYEHFPIVCKYSRKGELLAVFRIEQEIMKERERLNLDALGKQNQVRHIVIHAIKAGKNGFYILYNYPRTHILEFDNTGKQINDYYYVKSHDYLAKDFFVNETGKNDKIFYILRRKQDFKVDVLGIKK